MITKHKIAGARSRPGWKSAATKAKIKKAALTIFAQKGFAGTSTRMIAHRSGTNIALISRYFGGKEQLFKEVVRQKTQLLVMGELDYPAQDSLRTEAKGFIDSMFRILKANIDFFRIVALQSMIDQKFSAYLKEVIIIQEDERLAARLGRLKDLRLIDKKASPKALMFNIMTFVTGHVFYSFLLAGKSKVPLKKSVNSFLDLLTAAGASCDTASDPGNYRRLPGAPPRHQRGKRTQH